MTLIAHKVENAMLKTINVIYGPSAPKIYHVVLEKEIVIIILNVVEHFSVGMTTAQVDQQKWTVVINHAAMILIAWTKNATPTAISVGWIPTALIGPIVVKILHAIKGREIVIFTLIVKEHFSAALTIVQVDQLEWTAALVGQSWIR